MYFFYFYPLGLDRPRQGAPRVTRALEAVMVLVFLWVRYFPQAGPVQPWDLVFVPGNNAPWTVVTAVFLHAGWLHLLGNLVYFHVFGPPLEDRLGGRRFALYLVMFGACGNLVHGVVASAGWFGQAGVGVLGASGAIAGMLSFSLVAFYDARVQVGWWLFAPLGAQNRAGRSAVPVVLAVAVWLGLQVVQALVATETGSSTSFGAHFGGFAMGLALAAGMGQFSVARAEARAARARRYFARGEPHAAVGEWLEYLELNPDDDAARLELARARQLTGDAETAAAELVDVFRRRVDAGDVDGALAVHAEIARGPGLEVFAPDDLAKVAYYREKKGDLAGACETYEELFLAHPDHPEGQRALVRVIVLLHGKLADPARAGMFLAEAYGRLPRGGWRHYLEREFRIGSTYGAEPQGSRPEALR
jgi:membrane associated rhomboid family serine protease